MAFSFGQQQQSTPSFNFGSAPSGGGTPAATSTPAFGQNTGGGFNFSSFGAQSASFFGQQQSAPAFGQQQQSTPAFGQQQQQPAQAFGQQQQGTQAFGQQQQQPFGQQPQQQTTSAFGQTNTPAFNFSSTPAAAATGSPAFTWGATPQPALGAATQPTGAFNLAAAMQPGAGLGGGMMASAGQASVLTTKDMKPLVHTTKWDDLSPQAQAALLQLESIISKAKEDCRQLDQCERLKDVKPYRERLEQEGKVLRQQLAALGNYIHADDEAAAALRQSVLHLLHFTETAVNVFKRDYQWREVAKAGPNQVLPPSVLEALGGPVVLPSMFLRHVVTSLGGTVHQYRVASQELEQVLHTSHFHQDGAAAAEGNGGRPCEVLTTSLTNMHSYFVHVASKLEALHSKADDAREAFLQRRRQAGDMTDPFSEADRRERLKDSSSSSSLAAATHGGAALPAQQQTAATPSTGGFAPAAGSAPALGFGKPGATAVAGTPPLFGAPSMAAPGGAGTTASGGAAAAPAATPTGGGGLFGSSSTFATPGAAAATPGFGSSFGTAGGAGAGSGMTRSGSRKGTKTGRK